MLEQHGLELKEVAVAVVGVVYMLRSCRFALIGVVYLFLYNTVYDSLFCGVHLLLMIGFMMPWALLV